MGVNTHNTYIDNAITKGNEMQRTYIITTPTAIRHIIASSRKAAVSKLTGMSERAAIAAGQIIGVTCA
jgi:hypothetical protein